MKAFSTALAFLFLANIPPAVAQDKSNDAAKIGSKAKWGHTSRSVDKHNSSIAKELTTKQRGKFRDTLKGKEGLQGDPKTLSPR